MRVFFLSSILIVTITPSISVLSATSPSQPSSRSTLRSQPSTPATHALLDLLGLVLRAQQHVRTPPIGQHARQPIEEAVRGLHAVSAARVRERQQIRVLLKRAFPSSPFAGLFSFSSPRRKLGRRHVGRVEHQHVHAAVPQRRHEVPLHGPQERRAGRGRVGRDGPAHRLRCRGARVRVHVHRARDDVARPEDGRRVRRQEGDHHPRARPDLYH